MLSNSLTQYMKKDRFYDLKISEENASRHIPVPFLFMRARIPKERFVSQDILSYGTKKTVTRIKIRATALSFLPVLFSFIFLCSL